MSKQIHSVERKVGEPVFRFETGRLGEQADGCVLAQVGETTVLVAATASRGAREGVDFFPLTVDVEERMYAAGKIPGGFFRRESRPSEKAILTCRLTDRPLRPCFPDGFRNEVHIVATVMTVDGENPYDIVTINAASAALMLSGIPFEGPIGAVRLAHIEGQWVANPSYEQADGATFEIVVAGRRNPNGGADILMVEAGATERSLDLVDEGAPEMTEELVAEGLEAAKTWILEAIALQEELVSAAGQRENIKTWIVAQPADPDLYAKVAELGKARIVAHLAEPDKLARESALDDLGAELAAGLEDTFPDRGKEVAAAFRKLTKVCVRERILNDGIRIDGRGVTEIRPISCDAGVLPRVHGTGLFNRGQTQALSIVTLGMLRMEQQIDDLGNEVSKRYMHHYNFPPFSTGETGPMRGPKRREIGHGALAERALLPVIPSEMDFPYAIRVVSEVLSSNGSTSMASVCGSTLSLMDAGVPIAEPVAGIAMGLISEGGEGGRFVTLTDILGAEDAFGDMDFKVAGTRTMVTALQLDTKIGGIPSEVLSAALLQAREARLFILDKIAEVLPEPRSEMSDYAPRIIAFSIPVDKIGEVIGPKGKRINEIIATTGVEIDIEDDGTVRIGSKGGDAADEARKRIEELANPRMPQIGERFNGIVVKTAPFGAFVSLTPTKDGLVHISKLGGSIRLRHVEDVIAQGDALEVEVTDIDPMGKISLVPVTLPPKVAELGPDYVQGEARERRDRGGDRGGDRGRGGYGDRGRGPRRDSRSDRGGERGGERGGDRGPRPASSDRPE
ncbi:MAG TPA: polyribonucleotide nucleotidyltransferase [Actinomycetota bacterium]|nr:polyribonucleotide nucleotidyltransferase [Actinomycetota bacterium]